MLALSVLIASQSHSVQAESVGKGKPMVAIPGGPGFGGRAVWAIGFGMREGVKTYLFDQLGTGKNQPKGEMQISLDGTIEDLEALRKQAGHKKWIVFGQSWGVIVALVYAARHPQAIDSLVLTSIPGIGPESWVLSQNLQREIPESVSNDLTKIELDTDLSEEEKLTFQVPAVLPYYFYNHQQGKKLLGQSPAKPVLSKGVCRAPAPYQRNRCLLLRSSQAEEIEVSRNADPRPPRPMRSRHAVLPQT